MTYVRGKHEQAFVAAGHWTPGSSWLGGRQDLVAVRRRPQCLADLVVEAWLLRGSRWPGTRHRTTTTLTRM